MYNDIYFNVIIQKWGVGIGNFRKSYCFYKVVKNLVELFLCVKVLWKEVFKISDLE